MFRPQNDQVVFTGESNGIMRGLLSYYSLDKNQNNQGYQSIRGRI